MKQIDIEKLLQWALREELPKGRPVAASQWDVITSFATLGTRVDVSRGSHDGLGFVPGTPHADADTVAAVLRDLPAETRLSEAECCALLGPYASLDPIAVRAVTGAMFNMRALVIRCAILGTRMEWDVGLPQARVLRHTNRHAIVFGVDDAGQLILLQPNKAGTYRAANVPRAHVEYVEPSVGQLLEARAEYAVWHRALVLLVAALAGRLIEYVAMAPAARGAPWHGGQVAAPTILHGAEVKMAKLPLGPVRKVALAPLESDIERRSREWRQRRRQAPMSADDGYARKSGGF